MDVAAIVISILALLVAIGSAAYTRQAALAQARLTKIEEDRRDDELRQHAEADLRVSTEHRPGKPDPLLIVANKGQATATDLVVDLAPAAGETGRLPRTLGQFPSQLEPGEQASVTIHLTMGGLGSSLAVTVRWKDPRGPQSKDVSVSLF